MVELDFNTAEFLEYFRLETDPFCSEQGDHRFFEDFNLDSNQPLTAAQVIVYIQFMLNAAGPDNQVIIREDAHKELYRLSMGNVEQIKVAITRALHNAFAERTSTIRKEHVAEDYVPADYIEESYIEDYIEDNKEENSEDGVPGPTIDKDTSDFNIPVLKIIYAVVVIGFLSGGAWIFWENRPELEIIITKKIHMPDPELSQSTVPPVHEENVEIQIQQIDDPVMKFLAPYDLQEYEPMFSQALLTEKFSVVTEKIYRETGLRLIHFTWLPEPVKKRYHILETISLTPVQNYFFLVWKPKLVILKYENGVRGKEIRQLQVMLQKIDLYHQGVDGIVGNGLTRALIRFQRLYVLEETGFPDISTLFLLSALSK